MKPVASERRRASSSGSSPASSTICLISFFFLLSSALRCLSYSSCTVFRAFSNRAAFSSWRRRSSARAASICRSSSSWESLIFLKSSAKEMFCPLKRTSPTIAPRTNARIFQYFLTHAQAFFKNVPILLSSACPNPPLTSLPGSPSTSCPASVPR